MQERETNFFDLCVAFCRAIGRGIKAIGNLLASMIRITYRQWWIVLIVVIIGIVLANVYGRKDNRTYKVEAIAMLNGPTLELTDLVYSHLSKPMPADLSPELSVASLLNINPEDLDGVKDFNLFPVIDCKHDSIADYVDYHKTSSSSDTTNVRMQSRICLQFRTKNIEKAPIVEEALIAYLNNNPAMRRAYEHKRVIAERKTKFAKDQIEKLDSLTTAFYFQQGQGYQAQAGVWEKGFVLGRREIKLFTSAIYREIDHYAKLDYDLMYCTAPVVLENDFVINPQATNNPKKMTVLAILFGWIIGSIVAALVEQRKKIHEWLKQ